MENINIWLVLFAAHIKSEPVYLFILRAIPLIIMAMFGAMVNQLNSTQEITARNTIAAMSAAIAVGISVSATTALTEIDTWKPGQKIPFQIMVSLAGGMKAKQILGLITDKILALVKKTNV